MKTIKQIIRKIASLKAKLEHRPIVENFGQREIRQLESFVSEIWEYPYAQRQTINSLTQGFSEWCMTYSG